MPQYGSDSLSATNARTALRPRTTASSSSASADAPRRTTARRTGGTTSQSRKNKPAAEPSIKKGKPGNTPSTRTSSRQPSGPSSRVPPSRVRASTEETKEEEGTIRTSAARKTRIETPGSIIEPNPSTTPTKKHISSKKSSTNQASKKSSSKKASSTEQASLPNDRAQKKLIKDLNQLINNALQNPRLLLRQVNARIDGIQSKIDKNSGTTKLRKEKAELTRLRDHLENNLIPKLGRKLFIIPRGLPKLQENPKLENLAQGYTQNLVEDSSEKVEDFDHGDFVGRLRKEFPNTKGGEILHPISASAFQQHDKAGTLASEIFFSFLTSDVHRDHILSEEHNSFGTGLSFRERSDGTPEGVFVVNFATVK